MSDDMTKRNDEPSAASAGCVNVETGGTISGKWILMGDGLPDVDDHVLIYCPLLEPEEITCADRQANGMWVCDDGQLLGAEEPTHWQPLPAKPEASE